MAQSISLEVQGTPTSYSSEEREQKWRQAIEKEAKLKRDDAVERSLSASTMFTVTIRFELVGHAAIEQFFTSAAPDPPSRRNRARSRR